MAAISFYGIWGMLGVIVVSCLLFQVGKRLAGKFLLKLFMTPFKAKGAVLKEADVRVLSIVPAPAPQQDAFVADETDPDTAGTSHLIENDAPHDWYYLDVTITPTQGPTPMMFWEPSELMLVGPEAKAAIDTANAGEIRAVEIWQNGAWQPDDPGKYAGPQRLKLHIGVNAHERHLRFRYYFEIFGHIEIPPLPSQLLEETARLY